MFKKLFNLIKETSLLSIGSFILSILCFFPIKFEILFEKPFFFYRYIVFRCEPGIPLFGFFTGIVALIYMKFYKKPLRGKIFAYLGIIIGILAPFFCVCL